MSYEYLFVNELLTFLYGKLPSYCYYDSNNDLNNFWNNLKETEYDNIYNYLIKNKNFIGNDNKTKKENIINYVNNYYEK
jgi:hypothetical protein